VVGGWGIGVLDGLEDGYLEALGAVAFMAAELEVVERLLAAAAGLGELASDARDHHLAEPLQQRCARLVPRRLSEEDFAALVTWARSLPDVFERRGRILRASRVKRPKMTRPPTLRRLDLRDTAAPPTTSELRRFVREVGGLTDEGWDLLQKAWPDTAEFRRP